MDLMYLDNLDEFIKDEQKIVTYKWLSLSLNIGSNIAKQMLHHYVQERRKSDENIKLNVTYLIIGRIQNQNGIQGTTKIRIVNEDSLADVKAQMEEVLSVHVYSVQTDRLKDLSVLYSVDYDKVKENVFATSKLSGITCTEAQMISSEELTKLQDKVAYKPPPEPEKIQTKGTLKRSANQPSTKASKPAGIASMFKNQPKKPEAKKSPVKSESNVNGNKKSQSPQKKSAKGGGMDSFLSKGPPPKKIKIEKTEEKKETTVSANNEVEMKKPKEEPLQITKSSSVQHRTYQKKSKKPAQSKTKKSESENPLPQNKRKRIMQLSDSESSDTDASEEDESPLPPTPPPAAALLPDSDDEDVIQGTPQPEPKFNLASKGGRSRKMKQVVKTFKDEDGFLITKKEYECVSGTESEDETPVVVKEIKKKVEKVKEEKESPGSPKSKEKQPAKRNKKSSPTKSTQSSITSFFKKK